MTRVLLHIGRAKTGTSSLQYFLHNNPAFLEAEGYHYPRTIPGKKINHNKCFDELWLPASKRGPDTVAGLLERLHPERVNIVSAESLQNIYPSSVAEVFSECELKVICYLRNAFDMLVSGHAQAVKATGSVQSIDSYIEARHGQIDYAAFLGSWDAAFRAGMKVVAYDPALFCGGSVVLDFLHRFVSKTPPDLLSGQPERRNPSLTRTTLPYALHINRNRDQFPLPHDLTVRDHVSGLGRLSLRHPGRLQLPRRWRDRLSQKFQSSQQIWGPRHLDQPAPFEYANYPASRTDPTLDQHTINALHQEYLGILDEMRCSQEKK